MAHNSEVQTERTLLATALTLLLAGIGMMAAAGTPRLCDLFFYVGCGSVLLGAFFGVGVFWPRVRLLKLPSERRAERFQHEIDSVLVKGQALYRRRVSSDEELAQFDRDLRSWIGAASSWIAKEVSRAAADAFEHPAGGMAADVSGSFNGEHNITRLRLSWQLKQLRELAGE